MLRGADGAFYGSINVVLKDECNATTQPLCGVTKPGNCFFRATNLFDPASFRARDAVGGFTVQWANPYQSREIGGGGSGGVCATLPVTNDTALGAHITFRKIVHTWAANESGSAVPTFIAVSDVLGTTQGPHQLTSGFIRYSPLPPYPP